MAPNGGEKSGSFCNGYNEFAFLCNGTDQHKIENSGENVNRYPVLNLNRRILKIYPEGVILPQTAIFGCFNSSPCHMHEGQGVRFSTYLSLPSITGRANGM